MSESKEWKFIPSMASPMKIWSGHIEDIDGDTLYLNLYDESDTTESYEVLEININTITVKERQYISLGRTFFLAIGEDVDKKAVVQFEFTKYPEFTKEEIEEARLRGAEMYKRLNWE